MSLLRMKEIRAMNDEDLQKTLMDVKSELMHENAISAMGGSPPSPGKILKLRKNVARILTVINERKIKQKVGDK